MMHVWGFDAWQIVPENGRYFARKQFREAMRLCSDCSLGIGNTEYTVLEEFQFLTEQGAKAFISVARKLEGDEWESGSYVINSSGNLGIGTASSKMYYTNISAQGSEIIRINSEGKVVKFDLPRLVWFWLKNCWFAEKMKSFWYGEKYHHDRYN